MRVIIIDDEYYARKALEDKLKTYCPNLEIVAVVDGPQAGYDAIMEHQPDLIFLDIAMPQESGFDMLTRFDKINFEIIFVTGFDEYAINAIEFSAIGYILKPIIIEELIKSVHKAKERVNIKSENTRISNLLENLKHNSNSTHKMAVPTMRAIEFVKITEIIRMEGFDKMTKIYLRDGKKLTSSYNIGEYRKLLSNYSFFTCHKSHFINLNHIKKYLKEGTIILIDESTVPVAKRRKSEFINIMKTL